MKVKEESEKAGLKLNIQKTKIIASGPITSWQIDGETMETVIHFIFLGCKITVDNDCSHGIKRHLLFGRKATTNLDNILESITAYFSVETLQARKEWLDIPKVKRLVEVLGPKQSGFKSCIHDLLAECRSLKFQILIFSSENGNDNIYSQYYMQR